MYICKRNPVKGISFVLYQVKKNDYVGNSVLNG